MRSVRKQPTATEQRDEPWAYYISTEQLRENKGEQPFTLDKPVITRLDQWEQSVDQRGSTVDGMD